MVKPKYIRDHVTRYGKSLRSATDKKFGVSNQLIVKAALGDEKSLAQIADMGKVGERLQLALPAIKEHLKNYIQGNAQYNQTLAELYKEGGKSALAIDKAAADLTVENTRFTNTLEEYKAKLFASIKAEDIRHQDQMEVIKLQAWVDSQMREIDAQAQLEDITNKPFMAQIKADEDYENRKIKHILERGSEANFKLLPRKQYVTNPLRNMWQGVRDLFS